MKFTPWFIILFPTLLFAQEEDTNYSPSLRFSDTVYREGITSVQLYPADDKLGAPITDLNGGIPLELHFDLLGNEMADFSYRIIHCDAGWRPTDLEPNEYLEGFSFQRISEVEYSFNTKTDFVHYTFSFPDDMIKPRISGNYLILVYEDDDEQNLVLSRRLVVYENLVSIQPRVSASTVIPHRLTHQEVDFIIVHKSYPIRFADRDLHITLLQNLDWSRSINDLKPRFIKTDELDFDYMAVNEFEAGNEYRDFDTKSADYLSMEVEQIIWNGPENVVFLKGDLSQNEKSYTTRGDINGKFYIRNDRTDDADLEADYHKTIFRLGGPEKTGLEVYITGQFSNWKCLPEYKMAWDATCQCYYLECYFKQGFYNYRYETINPFDKTPTVLTYEGSYFQTENNYLIIAYNYDLAGGYDRVIGIYSINSVQR